MLRILMTCTAAAALAACAGSGSDLGDSGKPQAMSEEQMMQRMAELATPGAEHQRLQPLAGTFGATSNWQMDPSKPVETSSGTATSAWIFDGRFLETKYEGTFAGQPFHGRGITGFDNATKRYQAFWIDSMGTMMMPIMNGDADANGRSFTFRGSFDCPVREQKVSFREVLTIVDNNRYTMEWYEQQPDGSERRTGWVDYVRAR
jgi:hypothetical protein